MVQGGIKDLGVGWKVKIRFRDQVVTFDDARVSADSHLLMTTKQCVFTTRPNIMNEKFHMAS